MKKNLSAAALAMSLLSICLCAKAQSSFTLYGRLDNGIEYMNGVRDNTGRSASRWRAESGDWGTSMLGFKGAESIGSGAQVLFRLESGLNTVNGIAGGGASGEFFQRYALVGVTHPAWGTFQTGRALFISNGVWDFDPFVQQAWSSASLVRGRNWQQASNTLNYQSPTFAGFDIVGQYALGNQPNWNQGIPAAVGQPFNPGRSDGIQLSYTSSLFALRGIFDEIRDQFGRFSDLFAFSRETFFGANVNLGPFKIQGAFTHMSAPQALAGAPSSADHEWLGVTYQMNPVTAVTVGGYHINANHGAGHATIYEAGGTYALSKRTLVYLTAATARNAATSNFSLNATPPDNDPILATRVNPENPPPGHTQTGVYAGINHSF